jgi:hypothetical protein
VGEDSGDVSWERDSVLDMFLGDCFERGDGDAPRVDSDIDRFPKPLFLVAFFAASSSSL